MSPIARPWLRAAAVVSIILSAVLAAGCSKSGGSGGRPGPGQAALVDGQAITEADVNQLVQVLQMQGYVPDSTTAGATPVERQRNFALDRLVERQLVLNEAHKRGLSADSASVEQRLQMFKMNMGLGDSLPPEMTEASLRRNLADDMSISQYFEKTIVDTIKITPQEVEAYYNGNPGQFAGQEQVRARHILFMADPNASPGDREALRARAQDVLSQVRKGGDFAELARKHSMDPGSAPQGGDLGFFGRGQMVGPFDQAAFSLQNGQVSDIVETQFGYHIIKVEERKTSEPIALDQVRSGIEQALKGQKAQQSIQNHVNDLKTRAKIVRAEAPKS